MVDEDEVNEEMGTSASSAINNNEIYHECTILESNEASTRNEGTGTLLNNTASLDDEDRTCYYDQDLSLLYHTCAGTCGRSFHI